ncbi:MAG: SIMPL domain-containing protein [Myxococcota bacterium]
MRACAGAFACFGVLLGAACALADAAPDPMNRVSFQVERTRDVANDWIHAVVGITAEDTDSARLADHVNQTMTRALSRAKAATNVRVKSGGYSTHPIHEGGKLRRWRASQDLILESADVDRVTKLVGDLQNELQLRSIRFEVSPEKRRSAEDALIAEALAAFRARADIIRESLGSRGYEIVQVSVDTLGGPPVRPMMMDARAMSAAAAPALEGGSSRLAVHVSGTIELE